MFFAAFAIGCSRGCISAVVVGVIEFHPAAEIVWVIVQRLIEVFYNLVCPASSIIDASPGLVVFVLHILNGCGHLLHPFLCQSLISKVTVHHSDIERYAGQFLLFVGFIGIGVLLGQELCVFLL